MNIFALITSYILLFHFALSAAAQIIDASSGSKLRSQEPLNIANSKDSKFNPKMSDDTAFLLLRYMNSGSGNNERLVNQRLINGNNLNGYLNNNAIRTRFSNEISIPHASGMAYPDNQLPLIIRPEIEDKGTRWMFNSDSSFLGGPEKRNFKFYGARG